MPSFANANHTFFNARTVPPRVVAPTTGTTVTMRSGERALYLNLGGTIAALTVRLPAAGDGDIFVIGAKAAVTAVTWQNSAGTAVTGTGLPAGLAAGGTTAAMFVRSGGVGWVAWT